MTLYRGNSLYNKSSLYKNNSLYKGNSVLAGLPYPTAGLQVIVYNQPYEEEGTTYLRTSIGVGIPKVSGTGNDTIWDFSVLEDDRFDKGSYVGNAYGLPEYYDFPYVNIYYNDTSEATRYHWKLKDFHYANFLAQSLLLDNQFFLKAKATTDTSNEIDTIYQLNIYESAQSGGALAKLKNWIRVQTFKGDNIAPINYLEWTNGVGVDLFEDYIYCNGTSSDGAKYYHDSNFVLNSEYEVNFTIYDYESGYGRIRFCVSSNGTNRVSNGTFSEIVKITDILSGQEDRFDFYLIGLLKGKITNVSIKQYYENYYKS